MSADIAVMMSGDSRSILRLFLSYATCNIEVILMPLVLAYVMA